MPTKPLVSDEDMNELWRKHSHIPFGYMDISRRIESLVRKRLAERSRAGDTGSDDWNWREAAACIVEED